MTQDTTKHEATAWAQVSGDFTASIYGATFARYDECGDYQMVEVCYLPESDSTAQGKPNPYYVTEFTFDPSYLTHEDTPQAIASQGMGDDYDWTPEATFLALFEYGMQDPRQPSTYFDEYGDQMPTLKAVMDDYGIPPTALWNELEYDAVPDSNED